MILRSPVFRALAVPGMFAGWLFGCQSVEHPPAFTVAPQAPNDAGGASGVIIPQNPTDAAPGVPDGSENCGGEALDVILDRPNLYFVIDASGSMGDPLGKSDLSKYAAARRSIGNLLRAVGHRVRFGATLFPGNSSGQECEAGREIFPLSIGDAPGGRAQGQNGPTLQTLLTRLAARAPRGPTTTSATLADVRARLEADGGRSYVVLATDGAPNCNLELPSCASDACIPDIERAQLGEQTCGVHVLCCDKSVLGPNAVSQCMDDGRAEAEVAALRASAIPTYVIGMPGSETYAGVLGRLAEVGGTARSEGTAYYAVADEAQLMAALREIGEGLTIGCELTLASAPPSAELVNVYFDGQLVPRDAMDGWAWTDARALALRGDACTRLKSGDVVELEVVYGCRTVVR